VSRNEADRRVTGERLLTPVREPSLRLRAYEARVLFEASLFLTWAPVLGLLPSGDGHPVLVLPGFTSGDPSTIPLRCQIACWGYRSYAWKLGRNIGPTPAVLEGIDARLRAVYEAEGRPVSIVGASLGGLYGRELARSYPTMVRQVITLGSPYRFVFGDRSSVSRLSDLLLASYAPEWIARAREHVRPAVPVPTTSIYTRTDGVVRWHLCIDAGGPRRENIEVLASHSGMGVNPAVMLAVADRLAQPEGEWKPFRPPRLLRHFYPKPAVWAEVAARGAA
jgi:pimeloyl-ACP methyl ester carboxylesterase